MKKKIIYLHGLASSGATASAQTLRDLLPEYEVLSPDIPMNPKEALKLLYELQMQEKPHLIMGTSMGGMFAQQIRGQKTILVNPAFHVSEFMRTQLGRHEFMNPRIDLETHFEITEKLCDAYKKIEEIQFAKITKEDIENTHALFGTKDPLVHGYDEYMQHYNQAQWFEGEHRLNFTIISTIIVPLIKRLLES